MLKRESVYYRKYLVTVTKIITLGYFIPAKRYSLLAAASDPVKKRLLDDLFFISTVRSKRGY